MHRPYLLLAIAIFTGFCQEALRVSPAAAADYGAAKAAEKATAAAETESPAVPQPINTLSGGPAVPPAMFAALEDLSKKPIADGRPANSQPDQAARKTPTSPPGGTAQAATPPRVQSQHKAPPGQPAGFRGRHSNGPASKIEALRERIQNAHSHQRRHGFRRAG